MEFNYKGKSPVKGNRNPTACNECCHCFHLGDTIRCGVTLKFYFSDAECPCNGSFFELAKPRKVYFAMCYNSIKDNNFRYINSGLGLIAEIPENTADSIIQQNIANNKNIIQQGLQQLRQMNNVNKNAILTPIAFAEKIANGKWKQICYALDPKTSAECLAELNKEEE